MKKILATIAAVLLVIGAGCANIGKEQAPAAETAMIDQLILPAESDGKVQGLVTYNPFSPSALTRTWLYEPLMIRNSYTCEMMPWLATGYEWRDPQTLVLQLREGVKWSDGKPLTVEDVVFTIQAAKKYPAADTAGIWTDALGGAATAVAAEGNSVVITFDAPAPNKLDGIVYEMKILPKHLYGSVGDVTKYVDDKPVGTGPFVVDSYNGRRLTLVRNPDYWQAELIKVNKLVLEGVFQDPNTAALKLRSGELDWFTGDIPNPAVSVRQEGVTDFFYSPAGTTVVAPNNERAPMNDPVFREALAYAINRDEATLKATYGVMKPASQTMLKLPMQAAELPAQYQESGGTIPFDPARAEQLLDEAGYRKGPDGKRTDPSGKPLKLVFSVQAGWVDYLAIVDTVVRNWQAIGIGVKTVTTDPNAVDEQKKSGDFDFVLEYIGGGCIRSREWGTRLVSNQISDGKTFKNNVSRFRSDEVDKIVAAMEATTDPAEIKKGSDALVDIFMTEFPVIAMNYAPSRLVYRNADITGWPTEAEPYPVDAPLFVLTHLKAKQ
ncbi:ABC transporter substrate-binding protein [Microlunatus speluncae]|uniref:ABC transporter substrate-binding protein n=1 Tax=Microlunatus speluncae TaxID=2594267 RepID=UPI0012667634|nr:ABC transporter substrate-binding protein [Microlunatus speluncae]